MSFVSSTSPDISESLPFLLSAAKATQQMAAKQGIDFDIEIGGVGFQLASTDNNPYQRQTAPFQKDQFDSSKEAGEQTLAQFWVRSQTSWHHGAGITNYEPGSDDSTAYRFSDSLGVDVWSEGDVTLLKSTSKVGAVSAGESARCTGAVVGGVDVVFTNENGTIRRRTDSAATAYTGVTDAATRVAVAGAKILVGHGTAIASGDANGSALTDLWAGAASLPTPYWAKSRIIAAQANNLWELTLAGGAWPATPLFAHGDTGWTWSSVVAAPAAILAAGYSNGYSEIYSFTLQDPASGSTPVLGAAISVADFPPGEVVHSLFVYLGRYIGIGTSRGIRVGVVADNGQLQYGPLIVTTDSPVRSLAAADRFLYGAVTAAHPDGNSGAVRIDLQEEVVQGSLRFPYAWDARTTTTGQVDSIALLGNSGRVAMGVLGEGVYLQSATDLEPTGWVESGRIRFTTVEPKAFRTIDLTADIPGGQVGVFAVEKDGDATFLGRLSPTAPDGMDIRVSRPSGVFEWLSFRFALTRDDTDPAVGPTLESWQVKAIPAPRRQRLVSVPVLCMDLEKDHYGTPYGYEGFGWDRLQALEQVEDHSAVVSFKDKTCDETFEAQIEKVTFTKTTPRTAAKSNQGLLELLLRKLA